MSSIPIKQKYDVATFVSSSQVQPPAAGQLSVRAGNMVPATSGPSQQTSFEASTHNTSATFSNAESFTSITNITSSKYSITTNEDFNINIAINSNNAESNFTSSTSQRSNSTSCLSKSSCYISSNSPDPNITQISGGSVGNFATQGARLNRTRVSIPPSARNRDRSARPESFRLSSDMASHTRVLLKARSFAGATLKESRTHKNKNVRDYARTSLREEQLRRCKDQHTAVSRVNYQQHSFDALYGVSSKEQEKREKIRKDEAADAEFHQVETTSVEKTSIVIINTLTRKEICHESSWEQKCEPASLINEVMDKSSSQWNESARKSFKEGSSFSSSSTATVNDSSPKYKTSVIITDSGSDRDSIDSTRAQMVRARSFTGLLTPRGDSSTSPSPTRERLDCAAGSSFLKIPYSDNRDRLLHVATATRRTRLSRDGKSLRFSSDLGFGARPKSKREVFV